MLLTEQLIRPVTNRRLLEVMNNAQFKRRVASAYTLTVNKHYDIPNVSAISEDGKVVFIDQHFKSVLNGVDITKAIKIHEIVEKAVLDLTDYDFPIAFGIAQLYERKEVTSKGLDWDAYQTHISQYAKTMDEVSSLPTNVYFVPYVNTKYTREIRLKEDKTKTAKQKIGIAETKISLQYHPELNPKLWHGFQLKGDIRERLLALGYMFAEYCHIPKPMVLDVILTGGNANYNYTDKSDADVHVIFSKEAMGWEDDIHDDYLKDKKTLWSIKHGITIHGLPVELYAQDVQEPIPVSQGVYSLVSDKWVQQPTRQEISFNDPLLKKKVMSLVHQIDAMIKSHADISAFKELRKKLKDMRSAAIANGGEFSFENLVFKELRNRGYLDKVNNYMKKISDQELSL